MTRAAEGSDAPLTADERAALIAAHEHRVAVLRNSAQYRVGDLVVASVRTPRRLIRLPLDLWRLRKELLAAHRIAHRSSADAHPARDVVAATILDEHSFQALQPEWHQRPLSNGPAAEQLAAIDAALVFVEPTAEGRRAALDDALASARAAGIPTVFWNNQDPVHFDAFADVARRFEWIFTTDADCIDQYVWLTGHHRVGALPFAAQPRIHNPIGAADPRLPRACFAGSWEVDTLVDRPAEIELLLRPALDAGVLDIFDRMAAPGATGARFPAPYDRAVLGARSYGDLLREYRHYACFLNVNSVTTSPTMCSPRLFELLACRTPVVSTPSRAIDELLGDAVITVDTRADSRAAIDRLVSDPDHRDRVGHLGYRAVMSRHTYGHRVDQILSTVGIAPQRPSPNVTVLASTNRPERLDRLIDNFIRQRDVDAELIVLTNSSGFDRAEVDRRLDSIAGARAIHLPESLTTGECLNAGLAATDARFIATFDDDDHYGAHFLHDSLLVHLYVDAAIVGKQTFFAYIEDADETILRSPGNEFTVADRVNGSTMVIDRNVLGRARFAALNGGEDIDLCEQALRRGLVVFSADRYNYVAVRRRDPSTHSTTTSDGDYRAGSVRVAAGLAIHRTML
jgi:Glycosyl transferases group 1/DUF based on E. rectale Gene description (DUF3880)/Glycosyl transferase family 2